MGFQQLGPEAISRRVGRDNRVVKQDQFAAMTDNLSSLDREVEPP